FLASWRFDFHFRMTGTITIARRFCGPPDSGNGGYVCGRLPPFIQGPAVVRFPVPPPPHRGMGGRPAGGGAGMANGDGGIGSARPTQAPELVIPTPPDFAEAEKASRGYVGFRHHPYSTCFVCGPQRAAGDGLRIFPGSHPGTKLVASPWVPDASLADEAGG